MVSQYLFIVYMRYGLHNYFEIFGHIATEIKELAQVLLPGGAGGRNCL